MAKLTVTSPDPRPLKPLLEAALQNERRILEAGIRRTTERLQTFEARHGTSSAEFLQRYESNALPETLDFVEWVGECRLLARLREKIDTLEKIHIAN